MSPSDCPIGVGQAPLIASPNPAKRPGRPPGIVDPVLLSVAVIWGAGNVVTKWMLESLDPAALFAARMLVLAVLMGLVLVIRRRRIERKDLLAIMILGGGIVTVQQLGFAYAMRLTTASEGSLLISIAPLWTAILAAALGMERISRGNWVGIMGAFGGVAMLILGHGGVITDAPNRVGGDLLMMGSSLAYGVYMVVSKRWMQRLGALNVTCYTFLASGIMLGAYGHRQILGVDWLGMGIGLQLWFLYLVVLAGFVGLCAWYRAIGRTTASGVAVYQYLVPCISFAVAAVFLGERLSAVQIAGIAVTLGGVYLARIPSAAPARPTA